MRVGGFRELVSLLLILAGLLLVLGSLSGLIVQLHPSIPALVLVLATGLVLWRAGRAVRSRRAFGYWLAAGGLVVLIAAPSLLGNTRAPLALLAELALVALVAVSWWRDRHEPAA